jgi:hypothetical protein
MNLDDLANLTLGWREALLGAVALLVLYVVVAFIRLRRIRAARQRDAEAAAAAPLPLEPAAAGDCEPTVAPAPAADFEFPWNEPPEPQDGDERVAALESQIHLLREDLAALRAEVRIVREEMKQQVERVQAAQHVAPIYGDAMQLAMAGYDAAAIAERCGVARAEAELVVALIRNSANAPAMRER